jgi:hypothetical protein
MAVLEALRTVFSLPAWAVSTPVAPAARREHGNASPVASAIELDGWCDAD